MTSRWQHWLGVIGMASVAVLVPVGSASADQPPVQPVTEACGGPTEGGGQPVCGTLNPDVNEKVGYYFAYNVGSECTGGAKTPDEPEVEGEDIAVSAVLAGLEPATTYSYCLVATNQFGESVGEALTFQTSPAGEGPEQPLTEACPGAVASDEGQPVCGTLNPGSSASVGYHFAYNVGSECTGGAKTPDEPEVEGEDIAVSAVLAGLEPATTYSYCLVATNQFGESVGEALTFRTPARTTTGDGTQADPAPPPSQPEPSSASSAGSTAIDALATARRRFAKGMRRCRKAPRRRRARCRSHVRTAYERASRRYQGVTAPF